MGNKHNVPILDSDKLNALATNRLINIKNMANAKISALYHKNKRKHIMETFIL